MKRNNLKYIVAFAVVLLSCSKSNDTSSPGGNGGGGNGGGNGGGSKDTSCVIATISQVNSSTGAEFSLSAFYNSSYGVNKLVIFDSAKNAKDFEAVFNYVTPDSVRINQYQYLILDASKKVIRFATKSDLNDVANAEDYLFEYIYNNDGYLATKNLYVNGTKLPNFSTAYTYTNNLLTHCVMTAVSSGNLKVLESDLTHDNNLKIKNWIYTFPDAIEGYMYLTVLNFGNRVTSPLKQVVTKIYNPTSGALIDTWTTNYSNYKTDSHGYILSGEANGDLQQGIATFYGKTNFYYYCH